MDLHCLLQGYLYLLPVVEICAHNTMVFKLLILVLFIELAY
jgi:hypothetical protein